MYQEEFLPVESFEEFIDVLGTVAYIYDYCIHPLLLFSCRFAGCNTKSLQLFERAS